MDRRRFVLGAVTMLMPATQAAAQTVGAVTPPGVASVPPPAPAAAPPVPPARPAVHNTRPRRTYMPRYWSRRRPRAPVNRRYGYLSRPRRVRWRWPWERGWRLFPW